MTVSSLYRLLCHVLLIWAALSPMAIYIGTWQTISYKRSCILIYSCAFMSLLYFAFKICKCYYMYILLIIIIDSIRNYFKSVMNCTINFFVLLIYQKHNTGHSIKQFIFKIHFMCYIQLEYIITTRYIKFLGLGEWLLFDLPWAAFQTTECFFVIPYLWDENWDWPAKWRSIIHDSTNGDNESQ